MSTALEKYLHDHLAGAAFAVDLLTELNRKHQSDRFSDELQTLLREIEEDRDELRRIAKARGIEPGGMKEGVARFMEKLSRPKLVGDAEDVFSSFEACETIALGVLGKKALWDVLATTMATPGSETDFERLKRRAVAQHAVVEKLRLDLAAIALGHGERGG